MASNATVGPGTAGRATSNLGSHLSLVATDSTLFAAWTDSRRGTLTTGHQDVAVTHVDCRVTSWLFRSRSGALGTRNPSDRGTAGGGRRETPAQSARELSSPGKEVTPTDRL